MKKLKITVTIGIITLMLVAIGLLADRIWGAGTIANAGDDGAVPYDATAEEGTQANPFTILEIVPNLNMAEFGYLINGQEPIDIEKILNSNDATAKSFIASLPELTWIGDPVSGVDTCYAFEGEERDESYTWSADGTATQYGFFVDYSKYNTNPLVTGINVAVKSGVTYRGAAVSEVTALIDRLKLYEVNLGGYRHRNYDGEAGSDGKAYDYIDTTGYYEQLDSTEVGSDGKVYDCVVGYTKALNSAETGSDGTRYEVAEGMMTYIDTNSAEGEMQKYYLYEYRSESLVEGAIYRQVWKKQGRDRVYYYEQDSNGYYLYSNGAIYYRSVYGTLVYYGYSSDGSVTYRQNPNGDYVYYENATYRVNPDGNYVHFEAGEYRINPSGEYIYVDTSIDEYIGEPVEGSEYYYWVGLPYLISNSDIQEASLAAVDGYKMTGTFDNTLYVGVSALLAYKHSNVFVKYSMNFAYVDNDETKGYDINSFDFDGWYLEAACINRYDFSSALTSDLTLYARWIAKKDVDDPDYTIRLYENVTTGETAYYTLSHINAKLSVSDITTLPGYREGYVFAGWGTKEDAAASSDEIVDYLYLDGDKVHVIYKSANDEQLTDGTDDNVLLYAIWKPVTECLAEHTVKFVLDDAGVTGYDVNGGLNYIKVYDNGEIVSSTDVDKHISAPADPEDPTGAGRIFIGWYANTNNSKTAAFSFDKGTGWTNVTLYARWIDNTDDAKKAAAYTVNYNGNRPTSLLLKAADGTLLYDDTQSVKNLSLPTAYKFFDNSGNLKTVKAVECAKPTLAGNVEAKAENYVIKVVTVQQGSSELSDELIEKADMIVVSAGSHYSNATEYQNIWKDYNTKGLTTSTTQSDMTWAQAYSIYMHTTFTDGCPVVLDYSILGGNLASSTGVSTNKGKLYIMLQEMNPITFYNAFISESSMGSSKVNISTGKMGSNSTWYYSSFYPSVDSSQLSYYGITTASENCTIRNNCYVLSDSEAFTTEFEHKEYVTYKDSTKAAFGYIYSDTAESELAEQDKLTSAQAVRYILNNDTVQTYEGDFDFLEVQPSQSYGSMYFWFWYIHRYIPNYSGVIQFDCGSSDTTVYYCGTASAENSRYTFTIHQMTMFEYVGDIDDLNGTYDLVYFGTNTDGKGFNTGIEKVYASGSSYPYAYVHTGARVDLKGTYLGILGGDSDTTDYSFFSGNDVTKARMQALIEYHEAGYPIVFASAVYSAYSSGVSNTINSNLIDNVSYMYELISTIGTDGYYAPDYYKDEEIKASLANRLQIVYEVSDFPAAYDSDAADSVKYLNPNHESNRELSFKFTLEGDSTKVYRARVYIDMNADGKYDPDSELLDSCNIYDETAKKQVSYNGYLYSGHVYTLTRGVETYVGVIPWKLEVIQAGIIQIPGDMSSIAAALDEGKKDTVTGISAIRVSTLDSSTGTYKKEQVDVLQIVSNGNDVYLPTKAEINEAKRRAGVPKNADGTYKIIDFNDSANTAYITAIKNYLNSIDKVDDTQYYNKSNFWEYSERLEDFDISIERYTVTEIAAILNAEVTADYFDSFEMLILGFADCYNDITDATTLSEITEFIDAGKSVLFTHDTTSFVNVSSDRFDEIGRVDGDGDTYWGYNINRYFRNLVGMDRYGITMMYSKSLTAGTRKYYNYSSYNEWSRRYETIYVNYLPMNTTLRGTFSNGFFTAYTKTQNASLYLNTLELAELAAKDAIYKAGSLYYDAVSGGYVRGGIEANASGVAVAQGYTRTALIGGYNNDTRSLYTNASLGQTYTRDSNYVTKVSDGQMTAYPYTLPDGFSVATTHAQYYQLDLEQDNIVVWYCLGNKTGSGYYTDYYNDVRNNYYIYNMGNITYSGVGHDGSLTVDETKLFVNTMIAAYTAGARATVPKITNPDITSDKLDNDYLYVDYDANNSTVAIGDGVVTSGDTQTKNIRFKLTNNSIVSNKTMMLLVYDMNAADTYDLLDLVVSCDDAASYVVDAEDYLIKTIPIFVSEWNSAKHTDISDNVGFVLNDIIYDIDSNPYVLIGTEEASAVRVYLNSCVDGKYTSKDSSYPGYVMYAYAVKSGPEYSFNLNIDSMKTSDMMQITLVAKLRYGKQENQFMTGRKLLTLVRRGVFSLE